MCESGEKLISSASLRNRNQFFSTFTLELRKILKKPTGNKTQKKKGNFLLNVKIFIYWNKACQAEDVCYDSYVTLIKNSYTNTHITNSTFETLPQNYVKFLYSMGTTEIKNSKFISGSSNENPGGCIEIYGGLFIKDSILKNGNLGEKFLKF